MPSARSLRRSLCLGWDTTSKNHHSPLYPRLSDQSEGSCLHRAWVPTKRPAQTKMRPAQTKMRPAQTKRPTPRRRRAPRRASARTACARCAHGRPARRPVHPPPRHLLFLRVAAVVASISCSIFQRAQTLQPHCSRSSCCCRRRCCFSALLLGVEAALLTPSHLTAPSSTSINKSSQAGPCGCSAAVGCSTAV